MAEADPIVIVGGGILGASVAYHLRDVDRPVVLFEKNDLLGGGTTRESIAMLGLSYSAPRALRRHSRDYYYSLIDDGTVSFDRIGTLEIRETDATIASLERTAGDLAELGHRTEWLSPDEVREFGVDPPEGSRCLHIPDEGYLDPSEIIGYWADEAQSEGVSVRTDSPVTDVRVRDGVVTGVETASGRIATDTVVNTAGPWAPQINQMAGVSLPLRHNYGPILVLQTDEEISLPNTSFPNGHYFREESTAQVFAGRHGRSFDEAERSRPDHARSVPESFYLDVEETISNWIPKLAETRIVNEWVGLRTITPDGQPIVGETSVEGFSVACGPSGQGVTLAPAIGRELAETIGSSRSDPAVPELAPERFDD